MPAKISITTNYFPTVLIIDGQSIDVHVRRMSNREFDIFAKGFAEHTKRRGAVDDETSEVKDARDEADREWYRQALRANLTILGRSSTSAPRSTMPARSWTCMAAVPTSRRRRLVSSGGRTT